MMTVKELITMLEEVENKDLPIAMWKYNGDGLTMNVDIRIEEEEIWIMSGTVRRKVNRFYGIAG